MPVQPISAKRNEPVNTRDVLAKIANVGHDTYNKGKKILDSENEEIKQKAMEKARKENPNNKGEQFKPLMA